MYSLPVSPAAHYLDIEPVAHGFPVSRLKVDSQHAGKPGAATCGRCAGTSQAMPFGCMSVCRCDSFDAHGYPVVSSAVALAQGLQDRLLAPYVAPAAQGAAKNRPKCGSSFARTDRVAIDVTGVLGAPCRTSWRLAVPGTVSMG